MLGAGFAQVCASVLWRCEDDAPSIRLLAVSTLAKLEPADLAHYAAASLAARCADEDRAVRRAAVDALGLLETAALARHGTAALTACLDDGDWCVREAALRVLGQLPPSVLSPLAAPIAELLDDPEWMVRWRAITVLGGLWPADLSAHLGALLLRLEDPYRDVTGGAIVRIAAAKALGHMPAATLESASAALGRRLQDADHGVRAAALDAMRGLPTAALAAHASGIARKLGDPSAAVRLAAVKAVARLAPADRLAHADALLQLGTEDGKEAVRRAALTTLGALEAPEVPAQTPRKPTEATAAGDSALISVSPRVAAYAAAVFPQSPSFQQPLTRQVSREELGLPLERSGRRASRELQPAELLVQLHVPPTPPPLSVSRSAKF